MPVISLRLKEKDFNKLNEFSKMVNKDKSTVVRELLENGWKFSMIRLYRDGRLSLETLASKLELSISETIDLLSETGIKSPVSYDDYIKGFEAL
jgi:predicted HTH domain antitoxin